jgi:thiol-disulfide isomerase/thioredoxin
MTHSLQIGPLALPYGLLVTLAAVGLGWFIASRLAHRAGVDADPALTRMLLIGLVAARLGFVWQWRAQYFDAPLSILDIRDGGWEASAGLAAACLYGVLRTRSAPALRKPVIAAVLSSGLVWALGSVAIAIGSRDAVPLPDVSLTSIEGNNVALAGFAGKPTVINLWATWCPPCRREMPVLEKAQAANPDTNFVFVNQGERPDTIRRFIGQQGLKLHNVLVDERLQAGAALGHRALPTTLFFDASGQLVAIRIGELSQATLAQRLEDLRGAARKRTSPLRSTSGP